MNDLPEPDEDANPTPPRKTSALAWGCVILFFGLIVADILIISLMGTNANVTFPNSVGAVPTQSKPPVSSQK